MVPCTRRSFPNEYAYSEDMIVSRRGARTILRRWSTATLSLNRKILRRSVGPGIKGISSTVPSITLALSLNVWNMDRFFRLCRVRMPRRVSRNSSRIRYGVVIAKSEGR